MGAPAHRREAALPISRPSQARLEVAAAGCSSRRSSRPATGAGRSTAAQSIDRTGHWAGVLAFRPARPAQQPDTRHLTFAASRIRVEPARNEMKVSGNVLVVTGAGSGMGGRRPRGAQAWRAGRRGRPQPRDARRDGGTRPAGRLDLDPRPRHHGQGGGRRPPGSGRGEPRCRWTGWSTAPGIIQPFVRLKDLDDAAIERRLRRQLVGHAPPDHARSCRSCSTRPEGAHRQHVEHGRLPARAGPDDLRRLQGRGQAADRGPARRVPGTNVHVTVVFPGAVATNITSNSGVDDPVSLGDRRGQTALAPPRRPRPPRPSSTAWRRSVRVLIGRDARLMDGLYRFNPRRRGGLHRQPDAGPAQGVALQDGASGSGA